MARRAFLAGAGAAVGAAAWARIDRVGASELVCGPPPPDFPAGIGIYKQRFENWSGEIVIDELWTAEVVTPSEVATLASWGREHAWAVRARGYMHNWSPLVVTAAQSCAHPVLAVDATALSGMALEGDVVRVGTGATMEALLGYLDDQGHGLASVPAIGLITVGGALAIDGHGAVVPAEGEIPALGEGHGSISNQIVSLTGVVFDPRRDSYVVRTFDRATPEAAVLTTHLGRAFLTEAVLRVGPARKLRCRSITSSPASAVFAPPAAAGSSSFSGLLDQAGRVESIWFPYTDKPWTKVWSVAPRKPPRARRTTGPYPFPFSDTLPSEANELVDQLLTGPGPRSSLGDDLANSQRIERRPGTALGGLIDRVTAGDAGATPALGQTAYAVAALGLKLLLAEDLWGPAWHTQLYIKWTTLRYAQVGFVVLTSRSNVQQAVHDVSTQYAGMLASFRAEGLFPVNGALEIRASGVDDPAASGVPGAVAPLLSAVRPVADHPEWDTAIWVNVLTFPGTDGSHRFLTELEHWVRSHFTPPAATVRVEWSKGWAYTDAGPWTDQAMLGTQIPDAFRGSATGPEDWDVARERLNALDPHRVFSNPFLDRLLP
jgi:FAD/FMN-containing dehydrogenase